MFVKDSLRRLGRHNMLPRITGHQWMLLVIATPRNVARRQTSTSISHRSHILNVGMDVLVPKFHVLKIRISARVEAFDYETEHYFKNQAEQFQAEHRARDDHMSCEQTVHIPGLQEHILVTDGDPNCMLDSFTFWIATLFLLSWPYRLWVEKTAQMHLGELKKVVSIHDLQESKQELASGLLPNATCGPAQPSAPPIIYYV